MAFLPEGFASKLDDAAWSEQDATDQIEEAVRETMWSEFIAEIRAFAAAESWPAVVAAVADAMKAEDLERREVEARR